MRIWSLHPSYLDTKGLLAVWREGLLALHVLSGNTKGYKKHPQLQRFQEQSQPVAAITEYLHSIVDEAEERNYKFDRQKLQPILGENKINVTRGQITYELEHLKQKLKLRDYQKFLILEQQTSIKPHPLFNLIEGPTASWEKV
jgi:hypothetical protein